MAVTLRSSISGKLEDSVTGLKRLFGYSNLSRTLAGKDYVHVTQAVGTVNETVALVDIGTPGWVYIRNLDPTNFVLAGADGTNYPIKVWPGTQIVTGWNGASVNVKADTGACDAEIVVIEA